MVDEALVLPCEVDWVVGVKPSPERYPCGVVGLRLGYDEQGHPPNVLLAARATTSCLIYQIAVPSAAAFLLTVARLASQWSNVATQ